MPKCPSCGSDIDNLLAEETGVLPYTVFLHGRKLTYNPLEPLGNGDYSYLCPVCNATLATSEAGAIDFLGSTD